MKEEAKEAEKDVTIGSRGCDGWLGARSQELWAVFAGRKGKEIFFSRARRNKALPTS